MLRKHVWPVAALFAVGAIALSACGATTAGTAAPANQGQSQDSEGGSAKDATLVSGTARSNKADEKAGDTAPADAPTEVKEKWVSLRSSAAGELDPLVVNGSGFTMYQFDKDVAGSKKSACNGDCASTWPPVTVGRGGKVFIAGVEQDDVGFAIRDDGRVQVTLKGWPLYRFGKDAKPGDTLGHGVGGTWFGITPDGKKAGQQGKPAAPTPNPAAKPAASATLFTGRNFDDTSGGNFATGIATPGCNELRGGFLSLTVSGSMKVWSEANCKGKSSVVTDDVADVAPLGFPAGVKSAFLG
jgi:predicted lipoprotein with Yx(FWY)xxD motif